MRSRVRSPLHGDNAPQAVSGRQACSGHPGCVKKGRERGNFLSRVTSCHPANAPACIGATIILTSREAMVPLMVVRRALAISAISQALTFVLGFINVVVVSRLLRPDEIGVFSVAVSVLGLAHVVRDFGVANFLVQSPTVSHQQFRAAFTVAICSSWFIALLIFLCRLPLAAWYGHPGIAEVLLLVAVNFVILPLGTPAMAMLERDLQFGRHATMSMIGSFMQASVTIGAAWYGQSYLSMAWGSLAMTLTRAIVVNIMRPGQMFVLPTTKGLRDVARFGSINSLAAVIRELGTAAPDLIFGRTLGFAQVALYSRGQGVYRMAVDGLNGLVGGVYFATLASDLRKGGDGASVYVRATSYMLALSAPMLAVLAVLSGPVIQLMFGPQWERSALIASVICGGGVIIAPYALCNRSLVAAGKVNLFLRTETATQLARVAVLVTSIWLPLEFVVSLLLFSYAIEAMSAQFALRSAFGLDASRLMGQTWQSLALAPCAAVGPAITVWASQYFAFESHRVLVLALALPLAFVGWLVGAHSLSHPVLEELVRALDAVRRRWIRV